MDWIKLFGILSAVMIFSVAADGTRKKIRIHIPQKVKHIHHHKKIYITQHPATPQYAPAYLPTAEASMAIPSTAVASILPLSPVPFYEERRSGRIHGVNAANSHILPLYRARGYYGPSSPWERPNRGVSLLPPHGPSVAGIPSAFAGLSGPSGPAPSLKPRMKPRVKVMKINDAPRKKTIVRTKKPRRIVIQDVNSVNGVLPVSNFHEHFYSDVEAGGTIKKIRKPKRVEKIIDGDTEHIHTYSEEHIHKVVFDDARKVTDLTPLSGLVGPSPIIPVVPAAPMLAIDQTLRHPVLAPIGPSFNPILSAQGTVGSMGTPAHLEYMAYDQHEVTHDHSYHDHGETVDQAEFMKDFETPPKPSYNMRYPKTTPVPNFRRPRPPIHKWVPQDNVVGPPKQQNDYSYYDNLNGPTQRPKKQYKPYLPPSSYLNNEEYSSDTPNEDYRPYLPRPKQRPRHRNVVNPYSHQGTKKPSHTNRSPYYGHDFDFSTSLPTSHESPFKISPDSYSSHHSPTSSFKSYRDQFSSFKDVHMPQDNYEFDNYASPSTAYKENHPIVVPNPHWPIGATGKKKSISTQNISFGGQDHKMIVDHMADSSNISPVIVMREESTTTEAASRNVLPTIDFTLPQFTPEHEYYSQMAVKAFEETSNTVPDSFNHTFQAVQEIPPQTTSSTTMGTTTMTTTTAAPAPRRIYTPYTTTPPTAVAQSASFVSTHTMKIPKAKLKKSKTRRILTKSDTVNQKEENPFQPSPLRQRKAVKPNGQEKVAPEKKLISYERVHIRGRENLSRGQKKDVNLPQKYLSSASDGGEHKYGDRL